MKAQLRPSQSDQLCCHRQVFNSLRSHHQHLKLRYNRRMAANPSPRLGMAWQPEDSAFPSLPSRSKLVHSQAEISLPCRRRLLRRCCLECLLRQAACTLVTQIPWRLNHACSQKGCLLRQLVFHRNSNSNSISANSSALNLQPHSCSNTSRPRAFSTTSHRLVQHFLMAPHRHLLECFSKEATCPTWLQMVRPITPQDRSCSRLFRSRSSSTRIIPILRHWPCNSIRTEEETTAWALAQQLAARLRLPPDPQPSSTCSPWLRHRKRSCPCLLVRRSSPASATRRQW